MFSRVDKYNLPDVINIVNTFLQIFSNKFYIRQLTGILLKFKDLVIEELRSSRTEFAISFYLKPITYTKPPISYYVQKGVGVTKITKKV